MPMESPTRKPKRTQEKTEKRQQQLQQGLSLLTNTLLGETVRLEVLVVVEVVVLVVVGNNRRQLLLLLWCPFLPRVAVFSPPNWLKWNGPLGVLIPAQSQSQWASPVRGPRLISRRRGQFDAGLQLLDRVGVGRVVEVVVGRRVLGHLPPLPRSLSLLTSPHITSHHLTYLSSRLYISPGNNRKLTTSLGRGILSRGGTCSVEKYN